MIPPAGDRAGHLCRRCRQNSERPGPRVSNGGRWEDRSSTERIRRLLERVRRSANHGRWPGPARAAQLPSTRRALLPLTAAVARCSQRCGSRCPALAAQPCTGQVAARTANTSRNSRVGSPRSCYPYCMISRSGEVTPASVFKPSDTVIPHTPLFSGVPGRHRRPYIGSAAGAAPSSAFQRALRRSGAGAGREAAAGGGPRGRRRSWAVLVGRGGAGVPVAAPVGGLPARRPFRQRQETRSARDNVSALGPGIHEPTEM